MGAALSRLLPAAGRAVAKSANASRSAVTAEVSLYSVVCALTLGAAGLVWYSKRLARNILREKKIAFRRVKDRDGKVPHALVEQVRENPLLSAMELDPETCKDPLFAHVRMCSLADYYRSLDAGPAGVSFEGFLSIILERVGMTALLPAVHHFSPEVVRATATTDDLAVNNYSVALFSKLLSPLTIFAITSALNEATADMNFIGHSNLMPEGVSAVEYFLTGEQPNITPSFPPEYTDLRTFVLETDIPVILAAWGIDKNSENPDIAPEPMELLPDLCPGFGGAKMTQTPYKAAVSRILSRLLNRLGANALPAKYMPPAMKGAGPGPLLTVYLKDSDRRSGKNRIVSPEQLISALHGNGKEDTSHSIDMHIVSRLTSFGYGLSLKEEDGSYTQIPLVLPMDTGLRLLKSSDASDAHLNKIAIPACHAGIALSAVVLWQVKGPLIDCHLEWYQGIEGYTGWHGGNDVLKEWANVPDVEVIHDNPRWNHPNHWRAALEATTVASMALNITATQSRLPNGGYGYLGICMDSAASIQMALTGGTTLFPLILGGQVKTCVMLLYKELEDEFSKAGQEELSGAAAGLRLGIGKLPIDIIHQPTDSSGICERLLAMLPTRSPFALVSRARGQAQVLKEQMALLQRDEKSNGRRFESTRQKSFKTGIDRLLL